MKFDPRHLEVLAAVVDCGGVTEGAARLGRTQPSVSRSLALLEERVGLRLFEPGRKPLRPTELARTLAGEGRAIEAAGVRAAALVAAGREGRAGMVRVGGTPLFMEGVVATLIAGYRAKAPEIRIDQTTGYLDALASGLRADTLDIAIAPMRGGEDLPGLRVTRLLRGRNVIACGAHHPLAKKGALRLAEVASYPWIAPPIESPLYRDMRNVLEEVGLRDFRVAFTGGTLSTVQAILRETDTLTILPYSVVHMLGRQGTLAALPIRIGDPDRHLCALTRVAAPKAVERFRTHLRDALEGLSARMEKHERESLWRR